MASSVKQNSQICEKYKTYTGTTITALLYDN